MELIDIIITTLSLVLAILLAILLLSFIFYKVKRKDQYIILPDKYEDDKNEVIKKMREVIIPRKLQRYKVINENINIPSSTNLKNRTNLNGRFVVYNYIKVREISASRSHKFTKWSE